MKYFLQIFYAFLCFFFLMLTPVSAGKAFEYNVEGEFLGFSKNGNVFAYEEYGYHELSGVPYTVIHLINIHDNKDVFGSPVRVNVIKPGTKVNQVRNMARQMAQTFFVKYGISKAGKKLYHNNDLDKINGTVIDNVVRHNDNIVSVHGFDFHVKSFYLPTRHCMSYGKDFQYGYELFVEQEGQMAFALHKDDKIPRARGCPREYVIADIVGLQRKTYVVLLKVITHSVSHNTDGTNEGDRYVAYSFSLK